MRLWETVKLYWRTRNCAHDGERRHLRDADHGLIWYCCLCGKTMR